jgi:cytidylate kinase
LVWEVYSQILKNSDISKKRNVFPKGKIVLCICGMAGSGKSTVAKKLAKHYKFDYYSGGDALKDVASEMGYKITGEGWWETEEGLLFLEERTVNLKFDREIDKKLIKWAEKGNVILDSWALPWLLSEGFKIWLEVSEQTRIKRVAKRDHLNFEEAQKALRKKESKTVDIYKKLYGFELGKDLSPFHLILDSESLNINEVFSVLQMAIDNLLLRNSDSP